MSKTAMTVSSFLVVVLALILTACDYKPGTRIRETWNQVPEGSSVPSAGSLALAIVSNEGFEFYTGVSITAVVSAEQPDAFQKYFSSTGLTSVVEGSMRSLARSFLIGEFSNLSLQAGCQQRDAIYEKVGGKLAETFSPVGVTVEEFSPKIIEQKGYTFNTNSPLLGRFLGFRTLVLQAMACGFGVDNMKY